MTESEFNSLVKSIRNFVTVGIIAVIVVYMVQFLVFKRYELGGTTEFGEFGDYIGGILNPILGFATVILLIFSIRLQMKELGESTDALKASQAAHEEQVQVSAGLLDEAKKANAAQLNKMRDDAIRSQLTQNAEILTNECLNLMDAGFFDQQGSKLSLNAILHIKRRGLNSSYQGLIDTFPGEMDHQNPKNPIIKIHLLNVKEKVELTASTIIDLLPMLELNSLKELWLDRIHDILADCEDLRIFNNEEVFLLTQKLSPDTTKE